MVRVTPALVSILLVGPRRKPAVPCNDARSLATTPTMSGLGDDGDPYYQANIADWVLTSIAGCFLFVRLWCRVRFSHLGWDDLVLATSWVGVPPFPGCAAEGRTTSGERKGPDPWCSTRLSCLSPRRWSAMSFPSDMTRTTTSARSTYTRTRRRH